MEPLESKYTTILPSDRLWIDCLCELVESSISRGLKVVIIAIARKMARLFEYYSLKDSKLKNLIEKNANSIYVITEHAIPTVLSGASEQDTDVFVIDDFIVYGDSVETISDNVYYLSGIKPQIIAIGASDQTNFTPTGGVIVFPNPDSKDSEEKKCIITSELVPAFTARNSWNIISLKEPIDLEHTIFEMDLDRKQYESAIANMKTWANEIFPNSTIYEIRHKIPNSNDEAVNVTICTDSYKDRVRNNDFNKIRIFIGESKLCIVSYSPNIWDENELQNVKDIFIFSELNKAWSVYCSALNNISYTSREKGNDIFEDMFERRFKLRLDLCRVVWANYLKSFENALIFKKELNSLANKICEVSYDSKLCSQKELIIDQTNLDWLIGESLRPLIFPLLQNSLRHDYADCNISGPADFEIQNDPLLPENELESYNSDKASLALMCPGVDMTLSLIFYKLWSKYGLINTKEKEDRIRIGETYQSLIKYLRHFYSRGDLKKNINRWIDERIDLGIVVPKYEPTYATLGRRIWRRYFRPGEREDIMVDVARLCAIISEEYSENSSISFEEFSELIVPELDRICKLSNNQISLDCLNRGLFKRGYKISDKNSIEVIPDILWLYMILTGAFDLPSSLSWKEAKVATKDRIILFGGSPIY